MKKWSLILTGILFLLSMENAFCQLLFRQEMEPENYGRTGYQKYGRSVINRQANPKYDSFGNYIMYGVRAYEWTEERMNSRHLRKGLAESYSKIYKTNPMDGAEYYREYLNKLIVVNESQKAFSTRFIVGDEIRVKFSPLTVDMAALNGIRWDFNFGENNITFINSRADIPMWLSRDFITDEIGMRQLPVLLTGAHYERKLGVFNVSANYVNTYRSDSAQSRQSNSITGSIHYDPQDVLMLVVKVEDGSRFDGNGPRLYDIYPVIDGKKRPELLVGVTTGSWNLDWYEVRRPGQNNQARDFYVNRYNLDPRRVPQYIDFESASPGASKGRWINISMKRGHYTDQDWNPGAANVIDRFDGLHSKSIGDKKYLEANGEDYLQFWFQIPTKEDGEDISDIEFKSLIGNDYKFSVSEIYKNKKNVMTGKDATYFYTALECPGNVKDMSNLGWIKFRHGQETANMIMGFRVDTKIKDFEMVAEFNKNLSYRQYMHTKSNKFRDDSEAYFINIKRKFGKLTLGTEIFSMDPRYSTTFENTDPEYNAMTVLPNSSWQYEFHDDVTFAGGDPNPMGKAEPAAYMNNTWIVDTVDDNDDKDRYPDFHMTKTVRDRNGVFPGLDKNGNNRPDTNENDNLVPDYAEPFLLYNVDPDEYDFGDDFNNNGVIDERENDDKPDYPYDRDSKGYHYFGSFGQNVGMKYTFGVIKHRQIARGGETDVKYGKLDYSKFIPFFADVNFSTIFKKVEDTVEDHVFRYQRQLSTTLIDSFSYTDNIFRTREGIQHENYYDPLDYRDSYVTTTFLDTKLFRIPNLTVNIKFKYDLNHQNKTKNDIAERNHVFRADYKYYLGNLLLMPQVKFMSRKYTNHNKFIQTFHEQYFYPIFRIEYPLTFKTAFRAGVQGFPGLNSTIRNMVNDQLNYDERHYLIMLSNNSLYQGYDFCLNVGYEVHWQKFNGLMRRKYDRTDKVLFIRLVVGMEPVT
ncbi:MAG: hypothetical protein HOC71_07520 [Candidatus Latescibacteria bacterium]|nr:hypothetical protein [Candidatus Latescibacterota bacterium]